MSENEPSGSPALGTHTDWANLAALEPALLTLESDLRAAVSRRGRDTCIDKIWHHHGYKNRFMRLAGWHAQNPALRSCEAYDAAYQHLWRVMEMSTSYRTRRVGA